MIFHNRRRLGAIRRPFVSVVGGGPTWDPANKGPHISLSGGNLIATSISGSTANDNVRGTVSHNSGLFYAEVTFTNDANPAAGKGIGVANASFGISSQFLGADSSSNSIRYNSQDANVYMGSFTPVANFVTFTTGDVISIALSITAEAIWFRKNNGGWNNDILANQNPSGPTGGIFLTTMITNNSNIFLAIALDGGAGDVMTVNFGQTAYAQSVPAGYGNW